MITQTEFINSVKNKKNRIHRLYVRLFRFLCSLYTLNFKAVSNGKKKIGYTYITICNKASWEMVKASLFSLYKNSEELPENIAIISDGTWVPKEIETYFAKYELNVKGLTWQDCASTFQSRLPELVTWADKQIWGKKMAAIMYYSEKCPTLFADPDILWYRSPLSSEDLSNLEFKVSTDNSHNYDDACIESLCQKHLYNSTPINCGVVYMNLKLDSLPIEAIDMIKHESITPGSFAEQTVFAAIDTKYQSRWEMKEITSEISDLMTPIYKPTIHYKNMIGRHYLWRLKWIYWKDFFNILKK